MKLRQKLTIITFGLMIALISFTIHISSANSILLERDGIVINDILLGEEEFDNWAYQAYRTDRQITLQIKVEDTSAIGLQNFQTQNNDLAESLTLAQGNLDIFITLDSPQSIDKLTQLVDQHGLLLKATYSQVRTASGETGTLYAIPKDGELIPSFMLQAALRGDSEVEINDSDSGAFIGVVMIEAEVPINQYNRLISDASVRLVDVTPTYAKLHFQEKHGEDLSAEDIIVVAPYPTYWYFTNDSRSKN